jgi:photosystem II stability/assembly factor-like uncharacterized protein
MKRLAFLPLAAALVFPSLRAQGPPPDPDPVALVDWMRLLVAEGQLRLGLGEGADELRLFSETLPDGRTWMRYVADAIGEESGAAGWARIDEAVSVLLAEADALKGKAAAVAGTAAEAEFNAARKLYLQGAADLLARYRTAAGEVFDAATAPLAGLPALPDWVLPGEIRLHEIAGAGRINVETRDFSGRLSGLLELPGLETTLAVPGFSFDSRGNIDLLAYGQTSLPPNSPDSLLLTIPPRRPLSMHLGEGGDFSVAGGVRIVFPGGNEVEGFFDVDDPEYAFGLAFSGRITLELAQKMSVLVPVVDVDTASASALEAVAGFGRYFGSLGRGLESFVDASPELPSLDDLTVGAPPEFVPPETVVPLDVIDAWITGFGNDFVRPAINAPVEARNAALATVREMTGELRADIAAQRSELAPTLAQVRRLKRIAQLNGEMKAMLGIAAARQAMGDDGGELLAKVTEAADEAEVTARDFLEKTPADADFKTGMAAARTYLCAAANAQLAGGGNLDAGLVVTKIGGWNAAALAGFGFNADGSVADPARVAALTEDDLLLLAEFTLDVEATTAAFGAATDLAPTRIFLRRYFEKVRDGYLGAVASGDLEARVVAAVRLNDLFVMQELTGFQATPAEIAFMAAAWDDSFEAIAARGSGGATGRKLATDFMEAGESYVASRHDRVQRRKRELLGETEEDRAGSERGGGCPADAERVVPAERSFWDNLAGFLDGSPDAAAKSRRRDNVAEYARGIAAATDADFADLERIEADLQGTQERLARMADVLAFLDEHLPGDAALLGEFQTSWQALHLAWTPVAEAEKLHWLMAEYLRELGAAGTRYGDGVSAALRGALATAGEEAALGLARVAEGLAGVVDSIGSERFDFALPGDIEIRRLYGELAFNRLSLDWALAFGGRLEFPDINANFEIARATLDSAGEFSIAMRAASDSAFGLSDDFSLALEVPDPAGVPLVPFTGALPFASNGFNPRLDGFSGRGTLEQRIEGGTTQSYGVGVSYAALDPAGHRFTVTADFLGQRELFTPDILMFSGGFGFEIETLLTGVPTQGGAEVATEIGLLLRPEAAGKTPEQRVAADYFLNFAGVSRVDFSLVDQAVELTLVSGTLTLPPDIFSGPEDTPPTVALLAPVCVRFDFDSPDGLITWCDVNGEPARIAINNLGFKIPGVPGAEATDVATNPVAAPAAAQAPGFQAGVSAVLLLSGTSLPVIEKIDATFSFPIPGQAPADPGDNGSVTLVVSGENWRLDGFPDAASIALGSPLKLLDLDGFELEIKANAGTQIGDCPAGLSFVHDAQSGESTIRIASAMKVTVDPNLIAGADPNTGLPLLGEDATLAAEASGCFEWRIGEFPTFMLGDITFSGRFRLGGSQGIEIKGVDGAPAAFVRLANVTSIFDRAPSNPEPFKLVLEGAVNFADVIEFGLIETAFIWDGTQAIPFTDPPVISNLIPRFEPGGFYGALGENAIELGTDLLPLYPTELALRFVNRARPLFPGAGQTGLFDPLNLLVKVSGQLSIPNGAAIEGGSPGLFGSVDDLEILFERDPGTGFPFPVFTGINGLCLGLKNLDIPPLGGITGSICVQNLNDPLNLFFVGEAGAKVNDMGASVLLAMKPTEFIGAAFDLNAGPAGIPIDGGTLGGILLTGGRGGVNFKNSFADPTDFESYLADGSFPAAGSPERPGSPVEIDDPAYPYPDVPPAEQELPPLPICVAPTQPQFGCLTGEFPPPSINPLAERIILPGGQERIIYKGTSLSQAQVDAILAIVNLSPAQLGQMRPGEAIDAFVGGLTGEVRRTVDELIAQVPGGTDDQARDFYVQKIEELFNSLDDAAKSFFREAFRAAFKADPDASIYAILVQKAAEGVPCFDFTIKVGGTISHSVISSVLTGSGDVTLSTTGTAVLEGAINLVGIPVGQGTLAFSLTDSTGTINPAFGGIMAVALGPLELGNMSMSFSCRSLDGGSSFDAVVVALNNWVATNAGIFDASVTRFMIEMMDATAPRFDAAGNRQARDVAAGLVFHFVDLTDQEKFNWHSSFLNIFQIVADNAVKIGNGEAPDALPVDLGANAAQTLEDFLNSYKTLIVDILTNVNPRICFSGDIGPKLFGFPLTGGADTLLGGGLLYERVFDEATDTDFQQLVSQIEFSPSYLLLAPIMGGASFAVPAVDQASMGYSLRMPAFTAENIDTLLTDPLAFAADQASTLVEDSVLSFGYQLQPLGYRLADGQGRVIFPRLGGHPCNSNRFKRDPADPDNFIPLGPWVSPDVLNQTNPSIPTRREVILAALTKGQLQNPLWRGTGLDLASLFAAPGSDCYVPGNPASLVFTQQVSERILADPDGLATLSQLDFANDYFPHGGFIGGADFALPKMIADPPPAQRLADLVAPPTSPEDFQDRWLPNALFLFADPADLTNAGFGEPGYAYFTGTRSVGQMALYVPAPNPPAAVFGGDNAQALFDAIRIGNFEDIVNGSAGIHPDGCPVYPADQMMLSGWMDVPVLGLPVAQGLVDYNPAEGCFELEAAVLGGLPGEPQSWLHELVGASMRIQIQASDHIEQAGRIDPDAPLVGGSTDRLEGRAGELGTLGSGGVADFLSDMFQEVPKASARVEAHLSIPAELDEFLRIPGSVQGEANAELFVFSPFFDPDFGLGPGGQVLDPSPFAVANRRGGIGVSAGFEFGFFPEGSALDEQLVFEVGANVSLALTPDADVGVFPALSGEVEAFATLPGSFSFDGSRPDPFEFAGLLRFNSSPAVGEDWIAVAGLLSPIDLGPFLQVTPLPADANPDNLIGGTLLVKRTAGSPAVGIELNAAAVNVPVLGKLTGHIYGQKTARPDIPNPDPCNPDHFVFTPFTFSTFAGEPWSASMDLCGAIEVRSPFDTSPASPILFSAQPLTDGGQPIPFTCEIEGVGLESFELRLQIPNGVTFTLFPGTPQQSTFQTGSNSATCFLINSEGRMYFDSGTRDLELALPALAAGGGIDPNGTPLAEIRGRIELGFEPVDTTPAIFHTPASVSLTTTLGSSVTQNVTVTNSNRDASQLIVDASLSDSSQFEITPSRLILGGDESRTITVRFTPRSIGTKTANLLLAHNAPGAGITVPLTGTVTTAPKFNITTASIAFGATPLATPKSQIVTVTNTGSATLSLTNIATTGTGFSDNRTSLNIAPNGTGTITVTFLPTSTAAASGSLTLATNDPTAPTATVTLSGSGSNRFWYRQRKGGGDIPLRDVAFAPVSDQEGFAAGHFGGYLKGTINGKAWSREPQDGNFNFNAVVRLDANNAWMAGSEMETKINTVTRLGLVRRTTNGGATWTTMTDVDARGSGAAGSNLIWNGATVIPGTSFVALAGEFNGQGRISVQDGATSFLTPPLNPAVVPRLNAIAFGTGLVGLAVGDDLAVMKTVDGGKSWDKLTNLPALGAGIDFNGVAANPFSTSNYVVVGDGGTIIRTDNAGLSWTTRVSNTTEDLHAVVRANASRFFAVGNRGTVLLGSSTGLNPWIVEDALTREDLMGVTASGEGTTAASNEVWAVGRDGGIYHRLNTAISGPIAVVNIDEPLNVGRIGIGERLIREVRFANEGVADLTTDMKATGANAGLFQILEDIYLDTKPGEPGPLTVPPGCEAVYAVIFEQPNSSVPGATLDITSNDSTIDKLDPLIVVDNRNPGFLALGHLTAPGCLDLGVVPVGSSTEVVFRTRNIGEAPVNLFGMEVRHDNAAALFDAGLKTGATVIGVNAEEEITVTFSATAPGTYRGFLEIASDARNAVARVEVVARAVLPQQTVLVTTNIPGSNVLVDHNDDGLLTIFTSPKVFTLVDGPPANTSQIRRGTQIDVSVAATTTRSGVNYSFQRWTPGAARDFTFTADGETSRFTAIYAPSRPAGPAVAEPPRLTAARCDFNRPDDVAFGPWVRITEARLRLPWLGDGAGSDFKVEGALFLTLQRATGSLSSTALRSVVPFGPDAGLELLEVTPGAWNFDIRATGEAEFRALTPGLQVLNASALPPSDFELEVDLNASDFQRRGFVRFATLDELPLLPGRLALGPGNAEFEAALVPNQLVFRMDVGGSIRMLANPDSASGWLINQPVGLSFDANVGIEPFRFTTSGQIADAGLFRLHSVANQTTIGPEYDGVDFTLAARNFQVDILRSPERITLAEIAVDTGGTFNFVAALPSGGLTLGPLRVEPQSTAGTNENATVTANPFQGLLKIQMPGLHLNSSGGRWPNDQVDLAPFEFDSTNFSVRAELPSIEFDGAIELRKEPKDSDNYFEFRRNGNSTSVKLRNRQELFIGGMKVKFDVANNGSVSGRMSGRLGLEGPPPLDLVQDYASFTYDSNPGTENAHFEFNRYFFGIATRVRFGGISPLAQGCLLTDKSPEPIEEWPVSVSAP